MASLGSRPLDIIRLRVRSLFRRTRVEHELDDELRFHFETVVDRYVQSGMTKSEARRRARIEYGGTEQLKEECRDVRSFNVLENIGRDIVYALRGFRRDRTFTIMAVATIALAVGVNTGLFSLVYSLVYRSIPVSDPDSLRTIYIGKRGKGLTSSYNSHYFASFADLTHLRVNARSAEIGGVGVVPAELSWKDRARPLAAQMISDNLLSMLGGKPVLGRFISAEEASKPGSTPVAVLSYTAWQKYFGGAQDVVGRPMILNRTLFTIIGVADSNMTGPLVTKPEVWIPLTMQAITRPGEPLVNDPRAGWIQVLARRKPGVSDAAIRSEMAVLAQQAIVAHNPNMTAEVIVSPAAFLNLPEAMNQGMPVIAVLFVAVSLVLLVACANVANMLLARGLNRRREIAIRLSIGSSRRRLLQQLLVESVLLGAAASIVGLVVANVAAQSLLSVVPPQFGALQIDLTPDWTVLTYTLGLSLVTSLVFGVLPALNTLRVNLTPALKSEGLLDAGGGRMWLQHVLIGIQVAVCFVLLVSAGLLLRGFQSALNFDMGLPVKNVLIASMDFRQQQYTGEQASRVLKTVRDNASALPGVNAASLTSLNPLLSTSRTGAGVIQSDGSMGQEFVVSSEEIEPRYFATMNVPLLRGRTFTAGEFHGGAPVIVIDERLARAQFKSENPLGKRIRLMPAAGPDREIIGVAATTRSVAVGSRSDPKVYIPITGLRFMESRLLVSYSGARSDVAQAVERAVASLDPALTVRTAGIEDNIATALAPVKIAATAASTLGGLALVLACSGLYGVVSFAVTRRRREVGIRLALGADRRNVLALLMRQGLTPVLIGAVVGVAMATGAAQLLRMLLYGVSPIDPIAFVSTLLLLGVVAAIAALVPARAALSVDPAVTLRHD
jgi:predicted permease